MNESPSEHVSLRSASWLWFMAFAYIGIESLLHFLEADRSPREFAKFLFFGGASLAHFPKVASQNRHRLQIVGLGLAFVGVVVGLWYHLTKAFG